MVRYYCDLCGCEDKLSFKIDFCDVNVTCFVSYEVCENCHKNVHRFFKDIHMNMKGGK
ncbi:hypothetical protein LCGC14_1196760 [marine sediment metagenome]|uniref:Uncharacterized protein n=1 Tax=marine sediment metagenome TaxID=412755 RepID=A0A0F9LMK0_9ZZZZ